VVAARETTLQELLGGAKQYQVPLYQRTYSWGTDQLDKLWEDIIQLAEDRATKPDLTHFMGSLVLAPSPLNGPAGVSDWLVIDGQQRLTTLSLLLCALRDHLAQQEPGERDRLNELYLMNKWHKNRHTKLQPTQADRAAYLACVDGTAQAGGTDRVGAAYRSFKAKLAAIDDQGQVERLEDALMSGLAIVAVSAGIGDNVYRIFESLNNTGLKLTQADLLRNYLFMRLGDRSESVYQSLWLPMQESLMPEQLETLFWLDLVQRDPRVKQSEIHAEQQKRLDRLTEAEIEAEIARFNKLSVLFRMILDPDQESSPDVRKRLLRLQAWGSTTVYPVLLYLLELRDQGRASSAEISRAMLYLESFFVRRLVIGRATANLNRILSYLVTEIDKSKPVDEEIRVSLSQGRTYYATDDEVANAVTAIPFYLNGRAIQRKLVLQWLEESFGNKEPVSPDNLTIEHVLPQTPTPEWRSGLRQDLAAGETFEQVHQGLVHTLGNLTLTGYNPQLSNSAFTEKRELLGTSGLSMNQGIATQTRWGRPEIQARAADLARRIAQTWPGPVEVAEPIDPAWEVATKALAEIPAGAWTTYGALATLIGTHPITVGQHLAGYSLPNAHRVLQADGRISPNFHWADGRAEPSPRTLLESEGVVFDDHDRADPQQKLDVEDLAQLSGVTIDELPESLPDLPFEDAYLTKFTEQLSAYQTVGTVNSVLLVLDAWVSMGGTLWLGRGGETSCFLMAREGQRPNNLWPMVLYPTGKCEVVFQYLAARSPFDDVQLRQEFRDRLNKIPGVNLPDSKLDLRPGFPMELLADEGSRNAFIDALNWFYEQANSSAG
jgi:alkylated DNA nucleotide flippase Atl1